MRPSADLVASQEMFAALSQVSRLAVFAEILAAGPDGVPGQGLARTLGMKGSALTLHLRALEAARLIQVLIPPRGRQDARLVARIDRWAMLCAWMERPIAAAGWSLAAPPSLPVRCIAQTP